MALSSKRAPVTKDVEVNNALNHVYGDINLLIDSVNAGETTIEKGAEEGSEGDIRLFQDDNDEYYLEAKVKDGWVITNPLSFKGPNIGEGVLHTNIRIQNTLFASTQMKSVGIRNTNPKAALDVSGVFTANGPSGTFITFDDGDGTPSVAGGNIFKHHASTQTITAFDGGVCGQMITVISTAAITYDVTGTTLKGGSTDLVTANGESTVWVFDGTNWYLIGYMDLSQNYNVD